ncbi:Vms1/Ankzf1 family peptidyl-tRNA hydrolase [Streptomyces sp. NPDC046831]|uniref:baeRF2 domain-containing protein n=1 Tax=Streptomyces sp. NPDC046831 TaxID=3154805 RepID=UPI003404C810
MDLAFLLPLYERTGSWASVYVDTSRHADDTPRELRPTAREVVRELSEQGADEATCGAVESAIEDLRSSPDVHGRALFARGGRIVLDPRLARRPPGGGTAVWAPLPRAAPLLDLAGEDPVAIVAYVDRKGADFELRNARGRQRAGAVAARQYRVHRAGGADWSEWQFQLKVENTWEHNAAEIADALSVSQEESRADLLVLVGNERELREVRERLPRRLHDRVVQASPGSGTRLPDDDVDSLRAGHVQRRAEAALDRFRSARAPDAEGRTEAAEGLPGLAEAAREHRIEALLLCPDGPDPHRQVWIGEDPDQLAVRRTELTILGEQRSWAVRADDALVRGAAATGASAMSLAPLSAAAAEEDLPAGGLGAVLHRG